MALMRRRESMKRRKISRNNVDTPIKSLPKELLTTVLALVASKSVTDLCNVKLSCKYFFQESDDDFIFEHASLDKFSILWPMTEQASSFLKRCEECGNAESLYRKGMHEYFSLSRTKSRLYYLKRAAEKGHAESSYVYSIILICSGGQLKKQGLKLLASLKSLRTAEFRMKIRRSIERIWVHNIIINTTEEEYFNGRSCNCLKNWNGGGWEGEDAVAPCCESCFCDRETPLEAGGESECSPLLEVSHALLDQERGGQLLPALVAADLVPEKAVVASKKGVGEVGPEEEVARSPGNSILNERIIHLFKI